MENGPLVEKDEAMSQESGYEVSSKDGIQLENENNLQYLSLRIEK